jgi:Ca-activated chloride channel family protein
LVSLFSAGLSAANDITVDLGLDRSTVGTGGGQRVFLKLGLVGGRSTYDRPPLNVSIVLDRSGSMEGEKLERAKQAAEYAVERLGPQDLVSVVVYDDEAQVLVPATPARNAERVIRAIRTIRSGGSTALFAGVSLGAGEVRRFGEERQVRRVILLSDGLANVGPDSPSELGRLGASLRKEGISVSTIGLGLGYNEDLMARLAFNSDGNHAFVQEPGDLVRIFDAEFRDAASIVASEVDITITCRPGVRPVRIINRDGDIVGQQIRLRLNQILAAQEKYVLVELELPAGRSGSRLPVAEARTSSMDLAAMQRRTMDSSVVVAYSDDQSVLLGSVRKDVKEQVVLQLATEENEKAVRLADEGRTEEAKKVLKDTADTLSRAAAELSSPVLQQYAGQNADAAESLDDEEWSAQRKLMLEEQSTNKTQRSY